MGNCKLQFLGNEINKISEILLEILFFKTKPKGMLFGSDRKQGIRTKMKKKRKHKGWGPNVDKYKLARRMQGLASLVYLSISPAEWRPETLAVHLEECICTSPLKISNSKITVLCNGLGGVDVKRLCRLFQSSIGQ